MLLTRFLAAQTAHETRRSRGGQKRNPKRLAHQLNQGVIILLAALAMSACSRLIFQPEQAHRIDPARYGVNYRDIYFASSDGVRLHGWYLPAEQPLGTVIVAHGNAENISTHIANTAWLADRGYNVFIFDYRGYGHSTSTPDLPGVHRDTRAALAKADDLDDLPPERRVLLGQSLGGAVSAVAVARANPTPTLGALVMDSAPLGYRRITREKLAASWLTWPLQGPLSYLITADYAAIDAVSRLPAIPKLIIGNRNDRIVPVHHARALHRAASNPKSLWLIRAPRHIATFTTKAQQKRLLDWLESALGEGRAAPMPRGPDSA